VHVDIELLVFICGVKTELLSTSFTEEFFYGTLGLWQMSVLSQSQETNAPGVTIFTTLIFEVSRLRLKMEGQIIGKIHKKK